MVLHELFIAHYPNGTSIMSPFTQKRGIISAGYHFLFGPTESHNVNQIKENVAILMQNQNLQQSFIESNA